MILEQIAAREYKVTLGDKSISVYKTDNNGRYLNRPGVTVHTPSFEEIMEEALNFLRPTDALLSHFDIEVVVWLKSRGYKLEIH